MIFFVHFLIDSQKLDSCNEGGLNLISKTNNNNSNNNRNRTLSSNYALNHNELPSDDIDPVAVVKSERIARSSSRSHCETETEKFDEKTDDSQESASENEGDNNNNEDEERAEGEICEDDPSKSSEAAIEKSKHYKKKKRRRRKRELTLKSDQSQQIEDDEDDEMPPIKDGSGDEIYERIFTSYFNDGLVEKFQFRQRGVANHLHRIR